MRLMFDADEWHDRFQQARVLKGMDLADMAAQMGVPVAELEAIEGGTVDPTLTLVRELARHVQVRVAWLLGEDKELPFWMAAIARQQPGTGPELLDRLFGQDLRLMGAAFLQQETRSDQETVENRAARLLNWLLETGQSAGITPETMAGIMGLSPAGYADLLGGQGKIPGHLLGRLSHLTEIPLRWFFSGETRGLMGRR